MIQHRGWEPPGRLGGHWGLCTGYRRMSACKIAKQIALSDSYISYPCTPRLKSPKSPMSPDNEETLSQTALFSLPGTSCLTAK